MGRNRKKSSPGTSDQALMAETFGALLRLLRDLQFICGDDYDAVAIALLVHKVTLSDPGSDPGSDPLHAHLSIRGHRGP